MKRNKLALALAGLLLAPVASTAFAQSAQSSNDADQQSAKQLQTITVTGSAVPRIDVETPSPVTVLTAQQIERSGLTTLADVVRSISADNSGSIPNAFGAGFAAGSSGVALRGLTVNSTLVLIDGHRNASYAASDDGQRSFVDLNTIPLAAVERIEVLKDGASSLYGADAIAGVVNVILKPSYKGAEGTFDVGTSQHGGGLTRKATLLFGGGDLEKDGHNAYVSIQYQKDNPIYLRDRGFPYNTSDLSRIGGADSRNGNPANFSGSTVGSVTPGTLGTPGDLTSGVANPGALAQPLGACVGGTTPVSDPTIGAWCAQDQANQFGQATFAMEQGGIYSRFTVKLNDTTRAYLSASYFETKTNTFGQPSQINNSTPNNTNNIALPPTITNNGVTTLNPNNPFAAAGQYALINYAFGDIPAGNSYDNHNARLVGNVNGSLGDWGYDVTTVINHTWLDTDQFGLINYQGLLNAINTGSYNFINPSSNSAAVRQSIAPGYQKTSTSDLDSLDISANRTFGQLDGGPIGFAAGLQARHEAQNDPTLNPNFEFLGLGNARTQGSRNVTGAYVEFDAPLFQSLEVDVSGRYDHYTDIGNGFTPKVGLKWKPVDWFALRGTYSKGLRAPSFAENGSSSSQGFTTYGDSALPDSFRNAHNGSAYVTTPYALALQTNANPNIKPEKATNFTLGIVLQPTSWLNASVDYYNIEKKNVITSPDVGAALAAYYEGLTVPGVTVIADRPDPTNPTALARPVEVIGEYINANSLKTTGIDVDIQAHFDFNNNWHYVSELSGTQIFNWALTLPDGTRQQFVGTHGPYALSSGAGTPRTRLSFANTVVWDKLTMTATMYYTSGLANYAQDQSGFECLSDVPTSCHIGSFTYWDLTGSYDINDHISITGSVQNLFDRKAPIDPANYAANNYNPTYDLAGVIGRFYNVGVKVKL
ncbi:MAG TPA: TonB-dependent receptor [Dyella sp.]|uniref:TonB-dependent receptor plug domain-containing protein n=1 Tax=Dyella sp. TaxID=1869338 RepID=UPI002F949C26